MKASSCPRIKKDRLFQLLRGNNALFSWFFWISLILFLGLYVGNIVVLFLNPNQLSGFAPNQQVFLGFYNLNVSNNDLYLNWLAYLFGAFIILITGINCLAYWLLSTTEVSVSVRKKEIIIIFLTSVISLILIYVLNIFNKPLFDTNKLDLVNNNWLIDSSKEINQFQFNYVYDITVINSTSIVANSYLSLSKFSVIWIIMIIITILLYLISVLVCLYYSKDYLLVFSKKEYM